MFCMRLGENFTDKFNKVLTMFIFHKIKVFYYLVIYEK